MVTWQCSGCDAKCDCQILLLHYNVEVANIQLLIYTLETFNSYVKTISLLVSKIPAAKYQSIAYSVDTKSVSQRIIETSW